MPIKTYSLSAFSPNDVSVKVELRNDKQVLGLRYAVSSTASNIWWPPLKTDPERRDNLWQKTCFELFLGRRDHDAYIECNFSPCGDWAVYWFSSYRGEAVIVPVTPPRVTISDFKLQKFGVNLILEELVTLLKGASELLFSTTTILQEGETQSFWAHSHKREAPDFHDKTLFEPYPFDGVM